ncbi:MAG: NUDIX hydrolase [Dehalococcoidia bacterium]
MSAPLERHFTATAYIVADGKTLLIWHRKIGMWLPAGGHCEPNEDPVQAALREGEEESGLRLELVPSAPVPSFPGPHPAVLPAPAVILVEDIHATGQPFHQHIDHVYFTNVIGEIHLQHAMPGGEPFHWISASDLAAPFSLPAPDGTLVPVAEDVRLLGLQAIATVEEKRHAQRPIHP